MQFQPTDRDRIRIALDGDPATLNLLLGDDPNTFDVGLIINSFLLRTDAAGTLIPDLAVRVPSLNNGGISNDGRTVLYDLRPDAFWHDGVSVTADDVAFTFELVNRPDVNVADRSGYDRILAVRPLTRHRLEVKLRESYSPGVATFLCTAANQPYPVLPKHLLDGVRDVNHAPYNEHPVGCGPFSVKKWRRGESVLLERFDQYFRGKPPTRYLEMRPVPSRDSLVGLWHDRAIDVAGLTGERTLLAAFQHMARTRVEIYRRNTLQYLLMNHARSPLNEERTRQAICAAIDRERIMQAVLGAFYIPARGDRLPDAFGVDGTLQQQPYDPNLSRRLLAGRSLELTLVSSTYPFAREAAVLLQASLADVGIHCSLKQLPMSTLAAPASDGGVLASGAFDLYVGDWNPGGIADTSYLYRCDTIPPDGENYSRICDSAVDSAAHEEITGVLASQQQQGDRQMQRALVAKHHILYLAFIAGALATRRGLAGFRPSSIVRTFWNPWEWRWLND